MDASEIKIDLFRKLDTLRGQRLEEAYGLLLNFINGKSEIDFINTYRTEKIPNDFKLSYFTYNWKL